MKTYPLLQSQLGIFMEWMKDPSVTQYNLPTCSKLPKKVDLIRLKEALARICQERSALRTRFVMEGGEPRQYVDEQMQVPILVKSMTDQEVASYIDKDFVRPYDLLSGEPLIRIELIEAEKENWLLVDVHHSIGDGVTLAPNLTIYDIPAAYNGEPLEKVEYGMYEYAEDEQQSFGTENYERAAQYYKEKFAGVDFVTLAGNPESHLGNMVRESAFMSVDEVDQWCKDNGTTSNLLFMAAFSLVMSRLSREQQIAYYSVNHGRMDKRLTRAYGMFVKSVPILADAAPEQKAIDFIKGFRRELMSTIRYGVYPFNHFCRDLGVKPMVSFGFQGYAMQEYFELGDVRCTAVQLPKGKIDDDMSCVIYLREGQYDIRMESSDALNSKETLRTVADAVKATTAYMMAHPDARLDEIEILTVEAQAEVVAKCSGRQVAVDDTQTFPSLFMSQSAATPDAPAVVDEQGTYTYSELNALSGALAQQLVEMGVAQNHFVSIMLGYQKEFIVAAIGVEKAGGAYVPLDYDYPNDRLLYMLEDSESQVLVTSHEIYDEKNAEGEFTAKNILFIDDFLKEVQLGAADAAINRSTSDGLAYMIYTSGSTGKPKGVMISHCAKANFVQFIAREWGHTAKSRICCHSSFSFDASIEDLYPVLTVGGTLYTVPQEARKDLTLLHDFILKNGITGGCYTTQLGQMLLQLYPDLPVDYLVVGGEKMTANPDCNCRLINTYGPTEFTVDATFYELEKGREYKNIPIGRPLDNLAAYVVDAAGHLLPQGMPGELCMAGAQMASGYWKREELTEEKFANIMVGGRQVKVYHTGDLVRYNQEGEIEYLGRIDNQVKLRGFRIELGEIETLIGKYEGIQMESVQVREIGGVQHLCAYYTANREIDSTALKAYLSESLTDYMVPTAYMQLDVMPLTPNGKVNTKALPDPQVEEEELIKPGSDDEQRLFDLVAGILKHDQFGVTSNLISMGLTSLTAMRLSAEIEQHMGWKVPTRILLRQPTIRDIIEYAATASGEGEAAHSYERQQYYPLTENQRGVYIDWEMNREALQYNIPEVINFHQTDPEQLCNALRAAVDAHPSMKARLAMMDGDVMQERHDEEAVEVKLERLDFEPDAAFFQRCVRPFDLFNEPLYRLEVYQSPTATYLFIDVFHIIFDGVSSYIFMDDVRKALAGGTPVQEDYTAYDRAIDEKKWMESEQFKEAEAYFDNLLADAEVASYPHSQKPDGGLSGSAHVQAKVLASAIDQYCKHHGVTQNNFFMTALMQVLHRLTREKDILITTIDSGREETELQQITGMFVKTLTVVSSTQAEKTAGNRSFTAAVERMQEQFVGTKSLSIYPYTRIVERHQIRPEIMFVYQGGMDLLPEGSDSSGNIILQLDTTKAPIVLMIVPDTDGTYILDIEYSTKLYSRHDMEVLVKAYQAYVKQAPSHADDEKAIKLLSPAAERKMLAISKGDSIDYPHNETWIDMFLAEMDKHPDQLAVVDATGSLTYAQYNAQSLRLANGLISEGVQPGDVVAIMLPRVKEFFISVLGIQRAGASYVPIDMDYPDDRKQYMQEDSGAKIVITTDSFEQLCSKGDETPVNLAKPELVAYIIYTSGSTGKPKGVPVSHRGIRSCASWNIPTFELKPGKQNLHHPSFSFDASTFDLFYPLAAGATVHLLNEELRMNMDDMAQYIQDHHITGMTMSTALGMALLNQFDLPVEYIMLGGEKFMPVKKTGAKLFNGYGPTEFTVCSSFHLIDQEKDIDIPIGRAVPNSWSVICDSAGQLLPHGVPGELCLIGDQIAEGYLNRPELTAEKFAYCPFMPALRMYRTGDLARWNSDDELEFMGRIDNQVKLRGFRIELGEIENQASLYEGMLAVIAEVKTRGNNQYLCLYFTAEKPIDTESLRQHLADALTDYMVPDVYVQLDEMPMTPNGKINKKALPEPKIELEEVIVPETELEHQLFDIVADQLKLQDFGVTNNLISLGLSSLAAMRLSAAIQQHLNVQVRMADIMRQPTIRGIIDIIQHGPQDTENEQPSEQPAVEAFEKQMYYPLTENQRGVYIDWELNRDTTQYNVPYVLHFLRDMDADRLAEALRKFVDAHSYVKTRFVVHDGDVMQQRRDEEAAKVTVTALDHQPDKTFFQSRVRPFNPFEDDMYRLEVYAYGGETWLFKDFHHLISDGLSEAVFLEDMRVAAQGIELTPEAFTAYDFALYEQQLRASDRYEEAQQYFDRLLGGKDSFQYPHSQQLDKTDAKIAQVEVKIATSELIRHACHRMGITANAYFQTVATQVLHSLSREEDIVLSTISNGRSLSQMQRTVGMFVKTLPLVYTANAETKTFAEAAKAIYQQNIDTIARDFYPFTEMTERHGIRPEIEYAYQGGLMDGLNLNSDAGMEQIDLDLDTVKFPMSLIFFPDGDDIFNIVVKYDTALYSCADMQVLASALATYASNAAQDGASLSQIELLTPKQKQELLTLGRGDTMTLPEGSTFITEFTRQAKQTPDSIAVVDKDSNITYAELDRRSNIMAHYLQQLGLKPDQFVGIMLDRQKEFHVCVLGIQKSGAAYLPMDYEYPADRLQYMFEDSESEILVTTRAILAEKQAEGSFTPKHTIFIEEFDFSQGDASPVNLATPESRAYMIYTSGSTGKPKGVVIQQKAEINFVKFLAAHLNEQPGEHICCYASFSFDASVKDLYPPLTVGATLYLVPTAIRKDMNELTQWLRDNKINGGNYTTKIGELLMTNYELPVRYVMVGGEKLESFPPLNRGKLRLLNSYGPTETTVDVTTHWVDPTKEYDIPIGRPVVNTTAYIIDTNGRLTPQGVPGELCIGGVQLAEGYYNREELTAKMFCPCPFEAKGNRMYHTGDLCRWNKDGEIEYMGRIDNQVKLRGYRIELGEIESQIAKYEGVMLACVLVKEIHGVQNLCAYLTADHQIDIDDLKAHLSESLTEYMVPTVYMQLDAMPMTQNGKINRRALPEPVVEAEEIVAPNTPEEQQLWEFVTKMLKTTDIGVTTNLVSVGLSSIAAMRLSAQLMTNGLKLSAKDILGHPTIRELAGLITAVTAEQQLKPHERRQFYPMNESQRGMFVDWMMNPTALQYNIPSMFKFKDIDIEQLKRAIEAVAEAHPYLKCRLAQQGDDVVQVRNDEEPVHFEIETLTEQPDAKFFTSRVKAFDLLHEPLYRFNAYVYGNTTYLLIDIHHIIGDGSSNYVLAHELERAYRGEPLEKETYTAYDRALDEIALMESERGKQAEEFFDNLVGGVDTTIYPRSTVTPSKVVYGELFTDIEAEQIDAFCKKNALNPSSFFLTVFHHVLHRVTRDDNTLVYFISNGRSELALNNFFGVLVKTLPTVVSQYQGDLAQEVRNLHQQMQDSIANDFYPFTKMVERHGLKAEILYNYFVDLQTDISLGEHSDDGMAIEWDTAKTPLSITMLRGERGQYQSMLEYDATLYTKEDMEMLNNAFKTFAELCVLPGYADVATVPMLDLATANEVAAKCSGRQVSVDDTATFPALFMSQASATPDAPAVVDEQGAYTYSELNALSGAMAQKLVEMGVAQNNFVSIMLGYQKEFIVAAIAVEKAGGAYVPLDYDYPNDRLLYMLEDSESLVLVTSHEIFDEKNTEGEFTAKNILFIDDFFAGVSPTTSDAALNLATPDGLAYMIYTSGSTGKPKGVMISHRAKANFVQFIAREWGHTDKSRICCHSSFSFDASIEDLYPVLTVGGTLYTVPQDARKDLTLLHDFILKNGITGGCYTTQLGQMLLQLYPDLPVEYLVVGGEKMTANPDCRCRLINTYGPTEFTVDATYYELEKGREYKNIPIGRPLDNLAAYVVDANGHLLPCGMPGELCMAGPQMATGYWKREELTAEKFANIMVGGRQVKVYHTGDLVRYNQEGEIEYLGRIDNQVKLRGFRIELGEIETLIGKYEGIQMESVQVREIGGVQHLCAYYTADKEIDKDALRDFLAESLTDYMVPTSYMQLPEMPLTPNGKVNTKALPMPSVQTDELVAPVTQTEKALFKLAAEMLKHEQFGITSNLISMGLTSLTAMRFTVAAFNQFGVQIAVKEVMQHPTIHQLAALIDGKRSAEGLNNEQGVEDFWPEGKHYYYPITENQRGVFFDWEMNRDTTQYNVPEVHVMRGGDAEKLREALTKVVDAHPYLKTHFVQHEDDIMQIRRDEEPVEILMQALTEQPDAAFFQNRVRPFDLYHDTLYRLEIYTFNGDVYLFMDLHHSIYDGASSLFLLDDIDKAYKGEAIEPETYSAFDFALDELKLMRSERFAEAEGYFKNLLEGYETVVYPHSAVSSTETDSRVSISIEGQDISAYCQQKALTPNSYFLTILMHVLHAVTREDNITITTINNGRSDIRMMGVMGMFVKTIPVVSASTDGSKNIAEVAVSMQNQVLETQSRDFYPFTKMVELYGLRPEIMYVYQPNEGGEDNEDEQIRLALNRSKLPLTINVAPDGNGGYIMELEYDNNLYSKKDMERLGAMLKQVSENALTATKLSEVALLSPDEEKAMTDFCKGKHLDVDINKTFIQLFTEIAPRIPDKLAVADENSQFTYRELSKKSDALAHCLIENGVCPDDFVCVMLERCKEFILCVHAIHKAAAAYAPLDIDYPSDRLQYMIEDCQAKVLLTTHAVFESKCSADNIEIDESHTKIIFIDDLQLDVDCEPICLAKPENLAYMIYTSGSTGKPKGTMLHQAGLMNCVEVVADEQKITENDRVGVFYAFSFDAHVVSIYPVLLRGGSLFIMPSSIRKDMEMTVEFIRENKITAVGFPTAIGSLIVMNYPELPLRLISMGGERMDGLYSEKYTIVNAYGPTECTCEVTYFILEPGHHYDTIPIGRPTANNWGFVTDKYGRLLPVGLAGEFCFAGIQIGRGYWNLPEKTAEVFGDCPFVAEDHWGRKVRMYHTGDMVRYREDGELEFIGRIDNQVKLRGFRIELGEIENRSMLFDGIKQAAVLVKKVNGAEHLCLYYTETKEVDVNLLKQHLSDSLAEYMVPDAYMRLDIMPMTPNGKINRKALPLPVIKAEEIVAPENEIEKELLEIAFDLLKNEQFGVTTNLISMGITSLLAMKFSSIVKQKLNLHLPTKDILQHPTVRELASLTGTLQEQHVARYEKREYYPLTENQRGVYIDWELNRETTQYNIPFVKEFRGMSAEQLREALINTVEAHTYMKTRLAIKEGDVVQLRRDDAPVTVEIVQTESEPDAQFFQSQIRPFDLFNDDLYRLNIYKTPTTVWLLMDMHHIIFDGGSSLVFLADLERVFNGEKLEKEQFSAFDQALYEKSMTTSPQFQEAENYFDEMLASVELAIYPRSTRNTTSGNLEIHATIDRKNIESWCRQNSFTESNFFMTVLLQVLHRTTREEQLYITTIDNGRSEMNLLNCVGMFVKTLPVTSSWEKPLKEESMISAVMNTQEQFFRTKANCFYPFTKMVERHNIRPEIMYVYQGGLEGGNNMRNGDSITLALDTAKLPITVTVYPADEDSYALLLEYDGALYNREDMERLVSALRTFATRSIEVANLNTVSLLDDEATAEMLAISKGKDLQVDITKTFANLFTEQARRTPDAPAVVDKESRLTYSEMDRYSNIIAHKLVEMGIKPNDFVCVLLDRMKEFPLSVLGIHKAGAAYTPLDFEYPNDRLLYMLENSEAKVMITTHAVLEAKKSEGEFNVDNVTVFYIDDFMNSDEVQGLTKKKIKPIDLSSPDGLAYMIYTSGSTGKPKGAMLHQAGLRNFISVVIDMEKLTADDRISGHRSFSFDAHIEDMYPVLTLGGSFHIMPTEIRKDLGAIRDFLFKHQITGGGYSTAITCLLLNTFDDLPIRFITGGGEKMAGVYSDHIEIINVYGPTECTDDTSYYAIAPGQHIEEIPIGKSVANNWNFIIDDAGQLLPRGVAGELCFAGIQVGRGYWRLPERTAQSFVDCPFVAEDQWGRKVRMYHTGDLCRWNEDGELEYISRIDTQVKLRGFRIELGEIEKCAKAFEGMVSVVADVKTVNGTQHLCLYYTVDRDVDTEALRENMSQTLTDYMVPETFVKMESMPMTPNGKIDRKKLPIPDIKQETEGIPPSTKREQKLFDIVKELLGHEDFGVTDNLMRLGMTSLLVIRMVAKACTEGILIKVDDFMRTKSIRAVLALNQELMAWHKEPDASKPVAVLVQGETRYNDLIPYMEKLEERYNVLVVEAITTHFEYLFKEDDINEAIEFYYTLLDVKMMEAGLDNIELFTGHCFGADLSYRLAVRWQQDYPDQKVAVCLLDSFWVDKLRAIERPALDLSHLPKELLETISSKSNEQDELLDMYNRLNCQGDPERLHGNVILISAAQKENVLAEVAEKLKVPEEQILSSLQMDSDQLRKALIPQREIDNVALWQQYRSDLLWKKVDGNHMTMLKEPCVATFAEFIFDNLK